MRSAAKIKPSKNLDIQVEQLTAMVEQLLTRTEILQHPTEARMETKERLTEINQLKEFLGYNDLRSTKGWLSRNNITMINLGKRTYIKTDTLDHFIESKTVTVGNTSAERTEKGTLGNARKVIMRKRGHSKAAQDFLSGIKSS